MMSQNIQTKMKEYLEVINDSRFTPIAQRMVIHEQTGEIVIRNIPTNDRMFGLHGSQKIIITILNLGLKNRENEIYWRSSKYKSYNRVGTRNGERFGWIE